MLLTFVEAQQNIYSSKTKKYFDEVLSSYNNTNYRATLVTLYSVVIFDLLYKLKELLDTYEDGTARNILEEINKMRTSGNNKSKSQWEKELIENIYQKTELLDDSTYSNIRHLLDHRNLCAHPALNEDYDLYTPNKETVASHIRNMLEGIFLKPPIFIKNIVEMLVEELSEKKEIYTHNDEELSRYLKNRYFKYMSESKMEQILLALWKFVFIIDNEDTENNHLINRKAIEHLLKYNSKLLTYIKNNSVNFNIINLNTKEKKFVSIVALCIKNVNLYSYLSAELQFEIRDYAERKFETSLLIMWFSFENHEKYVEYILDNTIRTYEITTEIKKRMSEHFIDIGEFSLYLDFIIYNFSKSGSYDTADRVFSEDIEYNLDSFTFQQLKNVVKAINENSQLYGRNRSRNDNTLIVKKITEKFDSDFNFSIYRKFQYNETEVIEDDLEILDEVEF